MKTKVNYHVIYSIDTPENISRVKPSYIKGRTWKVTESGKSDDIEPDPDTGKKWNHRKYCAVLRAEQLREMLDRESWSTCKTMGAITLEYGWMDAISFDFRDSEAFRNAYISPLIEDWKQLDTIMSKHTEEQQKLIGERVLRPKVEELLDGLENLEWVDDVVETITLDIENQVLPFPEPRNQEHAA